MAVIATAGTTRVVRCGLLHSRRQAVLLGEGLCLGNGIGDGDSARVDGFDGAKVKTAAGRRLRIAVRLSARVLRLTLWRVARMLWLLRITGRGRGAGRSSSRRSIGRSLGSYFTCVRN
jgi:hypothetical protein